MRGESHRSRVPADAIVRARRNRKEAGEPERVLWQALRSLPAAKFRRQAPFGRYHADFCSHAARLIVEVDGDEHALKIEADAARTRFLEEEGYRVIRFGNSDVMQNLEGVITTIGLAMGDTGRGRP